MAVRCRAGASQRSDPGAHGRATSTPASPRGASPVTGEARQRRRDLRQAPGSLASGAVGFGRLAEASAPPQTQRFVIGGGDRRVGKGVGAAAEAIFGPVAASARVPKGSGPVPRLPPACRRGPDQCRGFRQPAEGVRTSAAASARVPNVWGVWERCVPRLCGTTGPAPGNR